MAQAVSAGVVLLFVGFQAYQTHQSSKENTKLIRQNARTIRATKRQADSAEKQLDVMKGQKVTLDHQNAELGSQGVAIRDQVTQLTAHTEAMQGQLEVMKQTQESFIVRERAYLTIKKLRLDNKPFEAGKMPTITFTIFNGGKTPGFEVTCRNGTLITEKTLTDVHQQMLSGLGRPMNAAYLVGGDSISARVASAAMFLDDASIFAWRAGAVRYFWVAQLQYTRIGDKTETTPFWFEFVPHHELYGIWTTRRVGDFVTYNGERVTFKGEPITYTPPSENEPPDTYNYEEQDD